VIASIPRVSELIRDRLRERILAGLYAHGHLPDEAGLRHEFGAGRAAVREAIRMLVAEQLIETRAGGKGGAIIINPTICSVSRPASALMHRAGVTLAEIYRMRALIEVHGVFCLANDYQEVALERLGALGGVLEAHVAVGDFAGFLSVYQEIHRALSAASNNRALAVVDELCLDLQSTHQKRRAASAPGDLAVRAKIMHAATRRFFCLLRLLQCRDSEGAVKLWRAALRRTYSAWLADGSGDQVLSPIR
jgi:DNA-binding FadR family transcriptional regulator